MSKSDKRIRYMRNYACDEGRIYKVKDGKCQCETISDMRKCLYYKPSVVMLCLHLSENLCKCMRCNDDL